MVGWHSAVAIAAVGSHQRSYQPLLGKCSLGTVVASDFHFVGFAGNQGLLIATTSTTTVLAVAGTKARLGWNRVGKRHLVVGT